MYDRLFFLRCLWNNNHTAKKCSIFVWFDYFEFLRKMSVSFAVLEYILTYKVFRCTWTDMNVLCAAIWSDSISPSAIIIWSYSISTYLFNCISFEWYCAEQKKTKIQKKNRTKNNEKWQISNQSLSQYSADTPVTIDIQGSANENSLNSCKPFAEPISMYLTQHLCVHLQQIGWIEIHNEKNLWNSAYMQFTHLHTFIN